jgi:hypothetical protein
MRCGPVAGKRLRDSARIDPRILQANGNVLRLEVQGSGGPQNKRVRIGDVTVLYQTQ